jgi:hypothetical protein
MQYRFALVHPVKFEPALPFTILFSLAHEG